MALIYKKMQSPIADKKGQLGFYPMLVKQGTMHLEEVANAVALQSSLSPGDVFNVVKNTVDVMGKALLDSKTVCLEGLGSFTLRTKSKAVATKKEVVPANISRLKVQFTPTTTVEHGHRVAQLLMGAKFVDIESMGKNVNLDPEDTDEHLEPGELVPNTGDDGKGTGDGKGGSGDHKGDDKPATGGDDKPEGGGEKPAGGGDKPAGGGDDPAGGEGHEPVDEPFDE